MGGSAGEKQDDDKPPFSMPDLYQSILTSLQRHTVGTSATASSSSSTSSSSSSSSSDSASSIPASVPRTTVDAEWEGCDEDGMSLPYNMTPAQWKEYKLQKEKEKNKKVLEGEAIIRNKNEGVVITSLPPKKKKKGVSKKKANTSTKKASSADDFGIDDDFEGAVADDGDTDPREDEEDDEEEETQPAEEQIAIVDLDDVEWWTVVPHPDRLDEESEIHPVPSEKIAEQTEIDEDGYVVVKNKDYLSAVSDFIASSMVKSNPKLKTMSPEELKKALNGTFSHMRTPANLLEKAWYYGNLTYRTYSWSSCAWSLYRNERLVRLVATGVFKTASWVMVLLL